MTKMPNFVFQQKAKMQKTHAQLQEAYSQRQLELAKSTNIDKLVCTSLDLTLGLIS